MHPEASSFNVTTVFSEGLDGVSCYRIPSVVQTDKGTLLAFAEARHGSCSDSAVEGLAVRRSTDGGQTWFEVSTAVGNASYLVGNPTSVYVRHTTGRSAPANTGQIMLLYVKHNSRCRGDCGIGNGFVTSDDDGLTWSPPNDVSQAWGPASGALPGPGTALQLHSGPKTGRIMVVSHHGAYQRDQVTYSDDFGKTWTLINQSFPKMDEAAMTQLSNGNVLLNMRHQTAKTTGRAFAISTNNGESFGPIQYDKALISPVCQASIVTIGSTTFFSNPASTSGRQMTTVRRSTDDAKTWSSSLLIEPGSSAGYSCLVDGALKVGATDHGGILYEAPDATIKFTAFPLEF